MVLAERVPSDLHHGLVQLVSLVEPYDSAQDPGRGAVGDRGGAKRLSSSANVQRRCASFDRRIES